MSNVTERLGHVLGWIGTGLAVLALLVGGVGVVNTGWEYSNAKVTTTLEAEHTDGSRYYLVGPTEDYGAIADAGNALKKFRGQPVAEEVRGQWTVFPLDGQTQTDKAKMEAFQSEQRALKWTKLRERALWDSGGIALFSVAVAVLFYLFGQACRYILSGPRGRPAE